MVYKIEYSDRNNVISCYLPNGSAPDKNAMAELRQMTALEETLERLEAVPGFFRGDGQRIEKLILTPDFHKGAGIPIGTAITLEDLSHPIKNFTHWIIWNIPVADKIEKGIRAV